MHGLRIRLQSWCLLCQGLCQQLQVHLFKHLMS